MSSLLKTETKSMENSDNTTGLMSGGMESWKLITALIQMMFCLGSDGSVVPHSKFVSRMKRIGFEDTYIQDVSEVVLSAASSTVEMYMALTSKELRKSDCATVQYLIECAAFHHLRLARIFKSFRVTARFKGYVLSVPTFSECDGGNKLSYLRDHMVECKIWMGADPRHVDTEMSESCHKVVVKRAYAACSKREGSKNAEMARQLLRKRAVEQVIKTQDVSLGTTDKKRRGRDKQYKVTTTTSRFGRDYLFSSESTAFSPVIFIEEDNCWRVDDVDTGKFLHDTMTPDVVNNHVTETVRELMLEDVEVFVVEKLYIRDKGYPEWSVECNNRRKPHVGILDDDDVDQKFSGAIAMIDGKQQYVRCIGKSELI